MLTNTVQSWHSSPVNSPQLALQAENLHILLSHTTGRDVNLCKSVLSAAVLEYPPCRLINWGMHSQGSVVKPANSLGVLRYLEGLPSEKDDDLVLIGRGNELWFQLRPTVLLSRYHQARDIEERRFASRFGKMNAKVHGIHHSIIFAASKICEGEGVMKETCDAAPESPLPHDMYGVNTDTAVGRDEHSNFRPRYPDSGLVIGPVNALRDFYKQVCARQNDTAAHDMQGVEAEIVNTMWAEQQRYRRSVLPAQRPWSQPFMDGLGADQSKASGKDYEQAADEGADASDGEYGLAIDYSSSIAHYTASSRDDARQLENQKMLVPGSEQDCKSHLESMPKDILASEPPDRKTSWKSVMLYTQTCTGKIPAVIHNSETGVREALAWRNLWFYPYLQKWRENKRREGRGDPLGAPAEASDEGTEDGRNVNNGAAWVSDKEKIEWWDLCEGQGFEKGLFDW